VSLAGLVQIISEENSNGTQDFPRRLCHIPQLRLPLQRRN
jgi:hypothetical protein